MDLTKRIRNFFKKKVFDPIADLDIDINNVGWHTVGGSNIYRHYQDHQYENGYSSIRVLAEGFALIEQYTIDKEGKTVPSNILDRLYTPNTDMSAYDFREALMVCSLVHDKVRIRVHYKGTRLNADSIVGFTFMEGFTERVIDGTRRYKMQNGEELTDAEVITLKSINPDNINAGFSPSRAARRWTRLDDYIADYQKGFFENGAVPAGEMIITARTKTEYNDIVDMLQAKHKGAGRNNNITYVHRPTDPNGQPMNSQIEWVPFSSQNKDMSLKELFEQVNQKIDSAYGVPASIRAVNDKNTYASIRVDELVLVKYALSPKTLKIWSKFTHELNRITGGTGVAITYDLEIPQIADEEKVKAESKQIEAATVSTLTAEGYTLDSAVQYVDTGDLTVLALGETPPKEKPEVVDSEEIKDSPSQPVDPYSKALKKINDKLDGLKPKQLDVIDTALYIQKMSRTIKEQMKRQVDKAVAQLDEALKSKAYGDTTTEEDKQFTKEMLVILLPLIAIYGNKQTNTGINIILQSGLSTEGIQPYEFSPAQRKAYERYLARIGTGYADQTAAQIRDILGEGILEGETKGQIEARLRNVILGPENEYRVTRLAKTEVNLSEGRASVSAMQNIQRDTGYNVQKRKVHFGSDAPCEFCKALLAEDWRNVDESYLPDGDRLIGTDGGILDNTWRSIDCGDVHANGHCGEEYRVKRS